ncbi:hypothetical protein C3E79_00195 [Corynebacterium liangguodongii]|uniref:Uncharacterized protein n=1 Tax=Corynebacterium liangguodongii TaxID=2079535 RepID=A0A2S0WGQ1_9CORY|nr:hypothetical protein C3E79_00195 [Corynebacterium liangguodongii]PWB99409.1 hypothetical protein DF219_06880 [Corynebacterium liangguodongii]
MTRFARPAVALTAAVALAAGAAASSAAHAQTIEESHPETAATNDSLPIIHTYRGSDHIKANILNPRPVCNSTEDYRTIVYKVTDNFLPVGTISTTNLSDSTVPLTQDLSRTQTIEASINGSKTETLNIGGQASRDGLQGSIGYALAKSLGWSVSGSLSWNVGQKIGPYDVPAGHTGEATYGFRTITMTGTQQRCRPNGTWASPTAWIANMPVKNEVRVKNYATPADSWAPNKGAQVTETQDNPNPSYNEDVQKLRNGENLPEAPAQESGDGAIAFDAAADLKTLTAASSSLGKEELDLKPYFTVSGAKQPGFAGSVALRVKNVGSKRYWAEFPAMTFRVEVKTQSGPKGVDRLITSYGSNGTHVRDLGYNFETNARIFEVTLSNPVNAGDDMLLGAFSFGDGNTSEGRLVNYMTVTQTGRLPGDTSEHNDQNVDSRVSTRNDFGNPIAGLF